MDNGTLWITSLVALGVGAVAGALAYAWWLHKQNRASRRMPRQSPIVKRSMVNSRERQVWRWLIKIFPEHHVMIKVPVTRFTLPMAEADREQWFALLSDVYCTFTVVAPDGRVVGCIDVAGTGGLPQANLQVKRNLFGRCDVAHWVVQPEQLPRDQDIYNSFIPSVPEPENGIPEPTVGAAELNKAREQLKAAVSRRRSSKDGTTTARSGDDSQFADSILGTDWAPDSFNGPFDSRAGELPKQ